jgi:hypothetical protein
VISYLQRCKGVFRGKFVGSFEGVLNAFSFGAKIIQIVEVFRVYFGCELR